MFPMKMQVLRVPWHSHSLSVEIRASLSLLGDSECQPSSHVLRDGQGDALLCAAGFRPVGLDPLTAVNPLNEGASFIVARSPDGEQARSRKDLPIRSIEVAGEAQWKALRSGVDHSDIVLRPHRSAETVARF